MPTFLGQPFEPAWAGTPPSMSKHDRRIWQKFRVQHHKEWLRVFYNCRVGVVQDVQGDQTSKEVLMWQMLTMFRIDAVVEMERECMIIEVRPNAARSALGSCILYKQLWDDDPAIEKPSVVVVVTDKLLPQMRDIFKRNLIRTYEVQ